MWRPVVGFEGAYEVSDDGRVRTVARLTCKPKGNYLVPARERRLQTTKLGYRSVQLWRDNVGRVCLVHQLVAAAFIGPAPAGMEVNHKDGYPGNNAVGNLEYVTHSANILHAVHILKRRNGRDANAKLTEAGALAIRQAKARGDRVVDIATRFGVSVSNVYAIVSGQRWRHVD